MRGAERRRADSELWLILAFALTRYARVHARRMRVRDFDSVRDAVADKTMDLVRQIDRGEWDPAGVRPEQIRSFLSMVARNAVADLVRAGRRLVVEADPASTRPEAMVAWRTTSPTASTADAAAGGEYADALVACASGMSARAGTVWFLRVVLELSSVQIARHPDVRTTPAAVDTMLRRCRDHMRSCMGERGYDRQTIPAGTVAALWRRLSGARGLRERRRWE